MNFKINVGSSRGKSRTADQDEVVTTPAVGAVIAVATAFALALFLAATVARAQDPPAAEAPTNAPAEETATDEEESHFTETITVTANKREEELGDVAASVSVVSQEQLESLSVDSLTDFAPYVPGLQVTSGGTPGQAMVSLRGIATISSGATVATYVDEAALGASGIYQETSLLMLDLLPDDIERVEVLRGPQGTLYGASAMGGLLKYVTRDPDPSARRFRIGGSLSDVEGAGDPGTSFQFSANLPLSADRVALRASYALNDIAGYIDNGIDDREDLNEGEQESARLALLWKSESDSVRFQLDVMQQSIDSDNNASVALDPASLSPLYGDLKNGVVVDEPFEKKIDLYLATLDWNLGWATLTSASAYSDTSTDQRLDATFLVGEFPLLLGLPPGISWFDNAFELEKFTQELRFTSPADSRFAWQFGAFYSDEQAENDQSIRLTDTSGGSIPGLDPLAVLALPSDYEELAAFGSVTFSFGERFDLDLGARFSSNDQTFAQVVTDGILVPLGTTPGSSDEDVFTWSVGPQFHLSDDAMLYARVATGYQPGGPNVALPGVPPSVDSSRLASYELGYKSESADRRWLLDLSAYRIDWEDIQIGASTGSVGYLANGGEATSQGFELSTAFKPTDRLRISLNGAYTDSTLSDDVPALSGLDGDQLPYIPELSWSTLVDYYFEMGGSWSGHVGGGYRWVDDQKSAMESDPAALPLDSYGAVDLYADVFNERWSIRAFARNVTDERAYTQLNMISSLITGTDHHVAAVPIQPRTFGLEFGLTF